MSEGPPRTLLERMAAHSTERLCFLADGVFAIAITLAALEIRPPQGWDGTLDGLWRKLWPSIASYMVSFVVIAAFWASHKRVYARVTRVDGRFTGMNLVLLGMVSLIPAATQLLYQYGARRAALVIYAGLVAGCGLVLLAAWTYAAFVADLIDPEVTRRERLAIMLSMLTTPVLFVAVSLSANFSDSSNGLFLAGAAMVVVGSIRRRLLGPRSSRPAAHT